MSDRDGILDGMKAPPGWTITNRAGEPMHENRCSLVMDRRARGPREGAPPCDCGLQAAMDAVVVPPSGVDAFLAEVRRYASLPPQDQLAFCLPAETAVALANRLDGVEAVERDLHATVRTWMQKAGAEEMPCDLCEETVWYLDGEGEDYTEEGVLHACPASG